MNWMKMLTTTESVKGDNKEYEREDKDEEKNDKDRRIRSDKADKGDDKGEDGGDRCASRKPRWENFFHQICSQFDGSS